MLWAIFKLCSHTTGFSAQHLPQRTRGLPSSVKLSNWKSYLKRGDLVSSDRHSHPTTAISGRPASRPRLSSSKSHCAFMWPFPPILTGIRIPSCLDDLLLDVLTKEQASQNTSVLWNDRAFHKSLLSASWRSRSGLKWSQNTRVKEIVCITE